MTFQTILVPVDMSDCSRLALESASELAKLSGGKLHLLYAYGLSPSEYPYLAYLSDQVEREVAKTANREIAEWAERFAPSDAEIHTSPEDARRAILALAKELDADLVVMGTHGRSGIKKMLMGSVAEFILRSAECPVLTVGRPSD